MFVLLAGPRSVESDGALERMAAALRGAEGEPRIWRDRDRNGGAASLAPMFVPEDAFDAQPIVTEDRVFVCQARIDNRDQVLQQLGLVGGEAIADSALLASAYDRWGETCVQKLAGDFSFAVWHRDGRVVAAVDPIGVRRLLWTRAGNGIALSPQLPSLLEHPEVSHEPDLDAMARLFEVGIDRTSSPFASIRALPGGHLLLWRGGEVHVNRWWNPDWQPTVWHRDPREYVAEARELFTRAVSAQLRSSSPISSTLSGGLDSTSVTAEAAKILSVRQARLTAYTSVPEEGLQPSKRPNWEPDDRAYAAEVVAAYDNIDHRLVAPAGRCTLDAFPSLFEGSRTPVKAATNLLWLDRISNSAAGMRSRVLLGGQHGNAAFSWRGEGTVWELAARGRLHAAMRQATSEARARPASVARVVAGAVRGRLRASSRRKAGHDFLAPGLRFISRASPHPLMNEYAFPQGSRRFWAAFATTPRHVWSPEPVLQWGIEWRDPTTDRRLLERLLQFPQAAFRVGGSERGLAREITAGLLPDGVRLRRTRGAQVPEAPSLIAGHAERYRAALATMRMSAFCRQLFDFDALVQVLEEFTHGSDDHSLALSFDCGFLVGLFLAKLEGKA